MAKLTKTKNGQSFPYIYTTKTPTAHPVVLCMRGVRACAKVQLPLPGPHPDPVAWSSHGGWLKGPGGDSDDRRLRHPQWFGDPNGWAWCWRASLAYLAAFSASLLCLGPSLLRFALQHPTAYLDTSQASSRSFARVPRTLHHRCPEGRGEASHCTLLGSPGN